MDLMGAIMDRMDDKSMDKISQSLGMDSAQAQSAVTAALPMLLAGLQRNTRAGGATNLANALDRDHDGSILDDIGGMLASGGSSEGGKILGHIFGNRQNNVEKGVSQVAGIDPAKAAQLMSMLAPLIMGALGKVKRDQGLGADDLGGLLEREEEIVRKRQPDATGLAGVLLDADGDGDVDLSDIVSRGGSLLGGLFKR